MPSHVVDAHQHFWDPKRFDYVWMSPKVQPLVRAFLPGDLQPLLASAGVETTVVVQAISSMPEAKWLLDLASENSFIAGVVTWCDLQSPDLGHTLDELQKHPKFKGIRHQIEDELEDRWMLRGDVLAGFHELARRGIPYDMLVRPRHLKHLPIVREKVPSLKMVIDHIAKPLIRDRLFEPWATDLVTVAKLENVWCKLSGMNTEANWNNWKAEDLTPYVQHVVKAFGHERVMFGSDWPVCLLAGSYRQTIQALAQALGDLNEEQQDLVWSKNAVGFYGLASTSASSMAGTTVR